jgi:hypothetical protein
MQLLTSEAHPNYLWYLLTVTYDRFELILKKNSDIRCEFRL